MKIAVLRAIELGDFIFSLPALHALRARYKEAQIHLLARPWVQDIAKNRPLPFDNVLPIPPYVGIYEPPCKDHEKQNQYNFFKRMRAEQYDLAIQLHGGGRNSNRFIKELHAKHTIGMKTEDAPDLDQSIPYRLYQHEVFRYLEVVGLVGAKPNRIEPKVPITELDQSTATTILEKIDTPYMVLHAGASDPRRIYPPEKMARVADLVAARGYTVVLTGIERERTLVDQVIKSMKHVAKNLVGRLNISSLIGVLSMARLVISNDTGPLHLARAVGTPTVGLYWFPNMISWSPVSRDTHETVISWVKQCAVCGRSLFDLESEIPLNEFESCGHMRSYLEELSVDNIFEKAMLILKR